MGLALYFPGWHPGIIVIVASRIVEALNRPTVVLCSANGHLKGSGRSVPHFDLHDAFGACSDLFLGFGGHSMAAGVSIAQDRLDSFRQRFDELVRESLGATPQERSCIIDAELPFTLASDFTFLKELELLQPFGVGNAEPIFSSVPLRVRNMRAKPGLMLLDLTEESSGITLKGKAWRNLANMPEHIRNKRIRIAYTPRIDRYNGAAAVELRLRDWKEDE
jgi:single-stranded-DNA-specific exonuclease